MFLQQSSKTVLANKARDEAAEFAFGWFGRGSVNSGKDSTSQDVLSGEGKSSQGCPGCGEANSIRAGLSGPLAPAQYVHSYGRARCRLARTCLGQTARFRSEHWHVVMRYPEPVSVFDSTSVPFAQSCQIRSRVRFAQSCQIRALVLGLDVSAEGSLHSSGRWATTCTDMWEEYTAPKAPMPLPWEITLPSR